MMTYSIAIICVVSLLGTTIGSYLDYRKEFKSENYTRLKAGQPLNPDVLLKGQLRTTIYSILIEIPLALIYAFLQGTIFNIAQGYVLLAVVAIFGLFSAMLIYYASHRIAGVIVIKWVNKEFERLTLELKNKENDNG